MLFGSGDDYGASLGSGDGTVFCETCHTSAFVKATLNGTVCEGCGLVISQLAVSSAISFDGANRPTGSLVEVGAPIRSGGTLNLNNSYDRFTVGKIAIRKLVSNLGGLSDDIVSKAQNTYQLAIVHDFVHAGRPVDQVAGACVYVACRKSKFPILLMDISQILQINLFKFGRLVGKLCKALHQKLNRCPLLTAFGAKEYVDPSMFVVRFARKLDFGDDERKVCNLACQVLRKMQNDWIQCGRHPAGLFGASLVIAARLLGYHRTFKEVARIVFIGGVTIGKRVFEFAQSAASTMSVKDFENCENFGKSSDPPAFTRALKNLKKAETSHPANIQKWLAEASNPTLFAHDEQEDDDPLDDDELDSYILSDKSHKNEVKVRENMYTLQYGSWENEQKEKRAEKQRLVEEKKALRKRKRHPKTVKAAKKRRSTELTALARNDPTTAPLFQKLKDKSTKSTTVVQAKIIAKKEDVEMKEEPAESTITINDTVTTDPKPSNNTNNSISDSEDEMSDIDFEAEANEFRNKISNRNVGYENNEEEDEYDFDNDYDHFDEFVEDAGFE